MHRVLVHAAVAAVCVSCGESRGPTAADGAAPASVDAWTAAGAPPDAGGAPDPFDSAWGLPACADSPEPPPVLPGEYAVDRLDLAAAAGDPELPIAG